MQGSQMEAGKGLLPDTSMQGQPMEGPEQFRLLLLLLLLFHCVFSCCYLRGRLEEQKD